jgi:hypothetical protein
MYLVKKILCCLNILNGKTKTLVSVATCMFFNLLRIPVTLLLKLFQSSRQFANRRYSKQDRTWDF